MIIIVEGPDGAGKSTAIERLQEQYKGSVVYHFGAPVEGEDQFLRYVRPLVGVKPRVIIYDRSWYSEFVYGPVMRNQYELEATHNIVLETLVASAGGGHVIYLTADIDTLWERCMERGETYVPNKEKLRELSHVYEEVMKSIPTLPVLKVDTTSWKI